MDNCGLILLEDDVRRLSDIMNIFLNETEAKACLVIDRGGQLMAGEGDIEPLDTMALSALAAGAFASTGEIARLVGETEFSVLFHQGRKESIHVSHVDDETLMLAIFDDNATIGIVRLYSKQAEEKLAEVLKDVRSRKAAVGDILKSFGPEDVEDIFKPDDSREGAGDT